ncbi:N-acyl-D-aspartate deacylase [subsurface metagenome]
MYDILIKNGKIISGSGNSWYYGDIAIENNKIIKISRFSKEITASKIIDAEGLYVAPGFIDGHSHSDLFILIEPLAEQKIMQGITTENVGMDGMSVAPIDEMNIATWKKHLSGLDGNPEIEWNWRSFLDYLKFDMIPGDKLNLPKVLLLRLPWIE